MKDSFCYIQIKQMNKRFTPFGVCVFSGVIFGGVYLSLFFEMCGYLSEPTIYQSSIDIASLLCVLSFSSFIYFVYQSATRLNYRFSELLYEKRYFLGFLILVVFVVLDINFSSISAWGEKIAGGTKSGLLFGVTRWIRSDEYNVTSLWNISQANTGLNSISPVLEGGAGVDIRLVYNSAAISLVTIFRPTLWGYVLFGASRGLSWFWISKIILIFLSSFDLFNLFSNNKCAAFAFACAVTFSPVLSWWGYWEGIAFGQYLVCLLGSFLRDKSFAKSSLLAFALFWFSAAYIWTLYPAWMVPFFYVFALMGLIVFAETFKKGQVVWNIHKSVAVGIAILLLAVSTVLILVSSKDAVLATSGTVYPGARFETGGNGSDLMLASGMPLFFTIEQPSFGNASALSSMMCFFPMGTIGFSLFLLRTKKTKYLPLYCLQLFLIIYIFIGVPSIIAKVTLFSNVPTARANFACGYLEIFLLLISASFDSVDDKSPIPSSSIAGAFLLTLLYVVVNKVCSHGYMRFLYLALLFLFAVSILFPLLVASIGGKTLSKRNAYILFGLLMFVSGLCVHPLQHGIGPVTDSALAKEISAEVSDDSNQVWAVEDDASLGNLCAALGAKTVTTTEAYPNLPLWQRLDETGKYEDIYNRYHHVSLELGYDHASFIQREFDHITVEASYDNLMDLGVSRLLTRTPVSEQSNDSLQLCRLELAKEIDGYYIYKVIPL